MVYVIQTFQTFQTFHILYAMSLFKRKKSYVLHPVPLTMLQHVREWFTLILLARSRIPAMFILLVIGVALAIFEQPALLIDQQLGVTDNVDEEHIGNLKLDLFLNLR